jgi:phosphoglycerate-specific signal transduction histidine kinase
MYGLDGVVAELAKHKQLARKEELAKQKLDKELEKMKYIASRVDQFSYKLEKAIEKVSKGRPGVEDEVYCELEKDLADLSSCSQLAHWEVEWKRLKGKRRLGGVDSNLLDADVAERNQHDEN